MGETKINYDDDVDHNRDYRDDNIIINWDEIES